MTNAEHLTPQISNVRRWVLLEVAILLGLGLGKSAVYSLLSIIDKLTQKRSLREQTTTLNDSVVLDRPWLDLAYQLSHMLFPLFSAALALYFLHQATGRARASIGFDARQPWRDLGVAGAMAAGVGIPGIAFYVAALKAGINTRVEPSNLQGIWWAIPVYIGFSLMNGIVEEVVMCGYLLTRLPTAGYRMAGIVVASCLIRGSYHLYQGFGGFVGNAIMGLVFCWVFLRVKRVMPLVVAHAIMDIVVFVGYPLVYPTLTFLH